MPASLHVYKDMGIEIQRPNIKNKISNNQRKPHPGSIPG